MKKYRILIQGKDFHIEVENGNPIIGFYTTRFVEAENPDEAELKAVDLIKNDNKLKNSMKKELNPKPMLFAKEIEELESFDEVDPPGEGYTFYPKK